MAKTWALIVKKMRSHRILNKDDLYLEGSVQENGWWIESKKTCNSPDKIVGVYTKMVIV